MELVTPDMARTLLDNRARFMREPDFDAFPVVNPHMRREVDNDVDAQDLSSAADETVSCAHTARARLASLPSSSEQSTCLTTWVPEKGMSDFDNLSQRRLLLSSFQRCYAVGVQRRRQTGESQLVLQTGDPMQPFRTTSRAPKRDERIVALIA